MDLFTSTSHPGMLTALPLQSIPQQQAEACVLSTNLRCNLLLTPHAGQLCHNAKCDSCEELCMVACLLLDAHKCNAHQRKQHSLDLSCSMVCQCPHSAVAAQHRTLFYSLYKLQKLDKTWITINSSQVKSYD